MRGAVSRIAALPPDVLALVLCFLSGFDLSPLSHVNRRFYYDLLAADGTAWTARLPSRTFLAHDRESLTPHGRRRATSSSSARWKLKYKTLVGGVKELVRSRSIDSASRHAKEQSSFKRLYFASTSLRFPGCKPGLVIERQCGGAVTLWDGLAHAWNADAFSLDVWFALLPETTTRLKGGILFAAQGTEWPGAKYGDDAQQFLHVDTEGNLYCSLMNEKTVVASDLTTNRWYHVAVSFARDADDWWKATQCVYLDGQLVDEAVGSVYPRWRYLNHVQLGSGVIDRDSLGSPSPRHHGWYGFNGVIDDVRFWNSVLTKDDVKQINEGHEEAVETDGGTCVWSLKRDRTFAFYGANIQRVRATQPREGRCVIVATLTALQ